MDTSKISAEERVLAEERQTVRDALHLLGRFEEMPSQWPDGPEVFPGALNQAYLALDRICAESTRLREERDEALSRPWVTEAARLRDALREIANLDGGLVSSLLERAQNIARDALAALSSPSVQEETR